LHERKVFKFVGNRDDSDHVGVESAMAVDEKSSTELSGKNRLGATTPAQDLARASITRTTITPAPGTELPGDETVPKLSWRERLNSGHIHRHDNPPAEEPYPGTSTLRFIMATVLAMLCLLTVGGAILVLLLWQQDRASGVLTSQLDRTWDLFNALREVERWVAFAMIPVAVAWAALAAINVRRATGHRRDPILVAISIPIGAFGAWAVGNQVIAESSDWVGEAAGFVLQAVVLAIPLLALERLAQAAEARHRPLRATYIVTLIFLAHIQFLGGLSTIDQTSGPDQWARLGGYLVIGALLLVLGSLSANEAARAIEEATDQRYVLRHKFGESFLSQGVSS
jgi:hypothetical protein